MDSGVTGFLLEGRDPAAVALLCPNRAYTYGELAATVLTIAKHLVAEGLREGERVLLIGDNSFFWAAAYLGILRAGLICVPVPANIQAADFSDITLTTAATTVFLPASIVARHAGLLSGKRIITDVDQAPVQGALSQNSLTSLDITQSQDVHVPDISNSQIASLMLTSGSTGRARAVIISHANIVANTQSIVEFLGLTPEDRIMTVLPFHYCFGASLLHTHLRVGGTLVLEHRFMYPDTVLDRMIETGCTGFAGVPSHFQILLRNSGLRTRSFPHLRYVQQAGGRLAPVYVNQLREALSNTQIFLMYGQTEATARLSYLPPEFLETKSTSIGRGIPGVQLEVVDECGRKVFPGQIGEITAQGESIAQGYWCAPEETELRFRNGRLYTGDMATVDADGFIHIVGRSANFLKCRGERVSCERLEDQLLVFDDLVEVAVVGVPDDILGEAVKVFIVPCAGAVGDISRRLQEFCREQLPAHLRPREIVVLPELPRNPAGKIDKVRLRSLSPNRSLPETIPATNSLLHEYGPAS